MARCAKCDRETLPGLSNAFCAYCGWRLYDPEPPDPAFIDGAPRLDTREVSGNARVRDARAAASTPRRAATIAARPTRTAPCPHCAAPVDRSLHFCSRCGLKTGFRVVAPRFSRCCGIRIEADDALFCSACGAALAGGEDDAAVAGNTQPRGLPPFRYADEAMPLPRLQLLNDEGSVVREIPIEREQLVVGRTAGDLTFDDDDTLSPEHALLTWRENALTVRDLGSANGSWLFVTTAHTLADGDVLLIGSQIIRFRRLPIPAAGSTPDRSTRARSRLQVFDDAMLEQLRADGTVRNVHYLSPGCTLFIGREQGDWLFPYDPTMSARHAEIMSKPQHGAYVVCDLGSRNGIAILVRGERDVRGGERLLFGRKMLRVDLA